MLERFEPADPDFRARIADGFSRQGAMTSLGGRLDAIEPGLVELSFAFSTAFNQQHGFLHGGIVATGLDTACGFAAFTLLPRDVELLTVEFKTNFLAPAAGERFRFRGTVLKAGRTLTVCDGEAFAEGAAGTKRIATMTATMMRVVPRA